MRTDESRFEAIPWLRWLAAACLVFVAVAPATAQSVSGYSEYFIPADETTMWYVFDDLDNATTTPMHSVIAVTAWSDNTTVYYDHWEVNGYNFDPNNPATADETIVLATAGAQRTFESSNIPTAPRGTATYYDGGDRIYVAGGTVTVDARQLDRGRGRRQPVRRVGDLPRQAAAHHLRPAVRRGLSASRRSRGSTSSSRRPRTARRSPWT